ncbi:MAG: D-alanyl-D-alanine carboxypeptidase, partial [Candidatus Orphnella occulta]|nr:D-alanyl-D-alanine carboxypeptidase [Candidatus Orphnella occulta]
MSDGGGGVKSDLLSPVAVVQLLSYMAEQADFKAYYDALPIMGVDGTLATVVGPESPVRGKVSAKTGTIVDYDIVNDRYLLLSKGLAGYMNTSKGKKFAFALYVNNIHMDN